MKQGSHTYKFSPVFKCQFLNFKHMGFISDLFSIIFWSAILIIIFCIYSYNKLRRLKEEVREKKSNVGGAVKKMVDIVNKAGEVVQGYKGFEQFTQLKVSNDNSANDLISTVQQSSTMMATLQGAAQRFPDLKASTLYQDLMNDIRKSHEDIEIKGQDFNRAVKEYNNVVSGLPAVLFARFIGFKREAYLNFDTGGMEEQVGVVTSFEGEDEERINLLLEKAGNKIAGTTKGLALQAGNMGKLIASKMKERNKEQYFYMNKAGVPQGPVSLEQIQEKIEMGEIGSDVQIAETGSDKWETIAETLRLPGMIPSENNSAIPPSKEI